MTPSRRKKIKAHVRCENPACQRTLLASQYRMETAGADPAKVHHVYWAEPPLGSFMCTCGHYTVRDSQPRPGT